VAQHAQVAAPAVMYPSPPARSRRSKVWRDLTYDGALSVRWGMALLAVGQVRRLSIRYERWAWKRCMSAAREGPPTVRVLGNEMVLAPTDEGISRELAAYRIHEPLSTMVLRKVLKPGMSVIDLGANIGYYTLIAADAVSSTGQVIAIEPVPENLNLLRTNLERNGCTNVQLLGEAMADYQGPGTIHIAAKSNWHSLVPSKHSVDQMEVPVSTIDEVVKRCQLDRVDLIRMDIEGFEVVAVKGMYETLKTYGPRLLIELHPNIVGADAIVQLLRDLQAMDYDLDLVIDRRRDWPWRGSWRVRDRMRREPTDRYERMSFDQLIASRRLTIDLRPTTILCGPRRRVTA
jgi:FkbM family methyltransferase